MLVVKFVLRFSILIIYGFFVGLSQPYPMTNIFCMSFEILCLMDCLGKECQHEIVCVCQECHSYSMIPMRRLP